MAASCDWLDVTTLHMVIDGRWTIEEWLQAALIGSELAFSEARYIDLVIEYRSAAEYIPSHMLESMSKMVASPIITSDRIRRILVVNKQGMLRMTNEMFTRSYGIAKLKYCDSLDEALGMLETQRAAV